MESNELRFKHIGISSDGAVVFCAMSNGANYSMPLTALELAEDWGPKMRPKAASIIHDGFAAMVEFDDGTKIDFPSDFVLHVCEPKYGWFKGKRRAVSGIGGRIREIREARGLTLEALARKSGIAKPNLSRLEKDKVTPTFDTLKVVAAALGTYPVLLVSANKPEHAWTWTRFAFDQWKHELLWKEKDAETRIELVRAADMATVFLATRPEHRFAHKKLMEYIDATGHDSEKGKFAVDAKKWAREIAAAKAA